jgi:hypothetical protein
VTERERERDTERVRERQRDRETEREKESLHPNAAGVGAAYPAGLTWRWLPNVPTPPHLSLLRLCL